MTNDTKYSGTMSSVSKNLGSITGEPKYTSYDYWAEIVSLDLLPNTLDQYSARHGLIKLINDIKYG